MVDPNGSIGWFDWLIQLVYLCDLPILLGCFAGLIAYAIRVLIVVKRVRKLGPDGGSATCRQLSPGAPDVTNIWVSAA